MTYDPDLATRLTDRLEALPDIETKKMFGGLAVMWRGHMLCGVLGDDLLARVGPEHYIAALSAPGARPMDFTGRPMTGMVMVAGEVLDEDTMRSWLDLCIDFVSSLPAKS